MKDAVIAALGRSAIGKAPKGTLRHTRPEELAAQVLQGTLRQLPTLSYDEIDDIMVGCSFPEAEQGMNMGRIISLLSGIGDRVPGQTINRFCSSGLQSIATAAGSIMSGMNEIVIAGGVESMSTIPIGGNMICPDPELIRSEPGAYMSMGITAENVADKYGISRQMQDEFALISHQKAGEAQRNGLFAQEIIPVTAKTTVLDESGHIKMADKIFDQDEGIRHGLSIEALGRLRPVFKNNGSVTAGNSSQTSDGAAFLVLMSAEKANALGISPVARLKGFSVAGVSPAYMGIGPVEAIPKALRQAGLSKEAIDLIELNEAFAAQSLACIGELELDAGIVNVNGGAIAMGHPLGCSGAALTVKLLWELRRRSLKYGMVSMCIGGGMGAAGVFELLE